jgi:ribosome maturation factor RimP
LGELDGVGPFFEPALFFPTGPVGKSINKKRRWVLSNEELTDKLDKICRPIVEDAGYELVLVQWGSQQGRPVVRLYVDAPEQDRTITLDGCAEVSRRVSAVLDVEDPLPDRRYHLEVSSPGLDRPLVRPEHFRRFVGSEARIRLKRSPDRKRRKYRGIIREVTEEGIVFESAGETHSFTFESIEKANLVAKV